MGCRDENRYDGLDPFAVRLAKKVARRLVGQFGLELTDRPDLEQVLVLAVWKGLPRHEPGRGSREAFITRIIRNQARKIIAGQKAGCRDYRLLSWSLDDPLEPEPGRLPVERRETFDATEYLRITRGAPAEPDRMALAHDLAEACRKLPIDLRDLFDLLDSGLSDVEIAGRLEISRSTFYERRKRLGEALLRGGISDHLK